MISEHESVRRLLRGGGVLRLPHDHLQLHQVPVGPRGLGQERVKTEVKLISWQNLEHDLFRVREVVETFFQHVDKDAILDYGRLGAGRGK